MFVLPFVLTVLLFWIFPIGNGVLLSFQDVLKDKWVGLKNYERLLSDKIFLKAVWNSVKYMIGTCALLIPFPLLFASLLNSKLMKKPGIFQIHLFPAGADIRRCCRYHFPSDLRRNGYSFGKPRD